MDKFITAQIIGGDENKKGKIVKVRQITPGSCYFIGEDGIEYFVEDINLNYSTTEIPDFEKQNKEHLETLKEMIASMDISKQDDHRAEIAEREYWRKLRGDLALKLIDCNNFKDSSIIERINEIVEGLILTDRLTHNKYHIK